MVPPEGISFGKVTPSRSDDMFLESKQRRNKGMVLPFEQHSLTFDNILYSVDMPLVSNYAILSILDS